MVSDKAEGTDAIQLVNINGDITHKLSLDRTHNLFDKAFADNAKTGYVIDAGDVIELSIWEAPPAMLFGAAVTDPRMGLSTTRVMTFKEQMVSRTGKINMPFAGNISVAGKTAQEIEADIVRRLKDKANQPQVLVRVIHNNTANVTVVGEVTNSTRVPLTARGEKLLDALAAAGGVRQPVGKTTLQLTRGNKVQSLALDIIIKDPKQNITLQSGDVITALFQPFSFTVMGATAKNEEINFEAQGVSLGQALARAGGLQDAKADARAVFVFRFEDSKALNWSKPPKTTPEGKVPVVYQLNLNDPGSFLLAQGFPMDDKDVLYVASAPAAEFQKFLNMLTQTFFIIRSISGVGGF
jgi:polysaccharide export outer membrane protein